MLVRLFERLMSQGTPLHEFARGRVYRGVTTGLNSAFVVDQATRDALVAADPKSAEIIKPWLRGRDIKRWAFEWAGLYLLHIPWTLNIALYPAVEQHLAAFKSALEKRPEARRGVFPWYALSRYGAEYLDEFSGAKVICNRFINEAAFAYDESGMFHNDACYFLRSESPALAAIVNSQISWWLLNHLATRLQNGYIQIFVNQIKRLPVPIFDQRMEGALSAGVSQLIANPLDNTAESEVEAMVADAYGLSSVERRLIQDWFLENSASAGSN